MIAKCIRGSLFLLFSLFVGALGVLSPAAPAAAERSNYTIVETFRNATAPDWILQNSTLTGNGTIDPVGDGWLRLTENRPQDAGSAIYNLAFPSSDGFQVSFEYATYGGNGADGFSFYLIDGATTFPTVGAPGGGLGYAQRNTDTFNNPGVTNGYIGIGFDEYGNFSAGESGGCAISCTGTPNAVSIRGSGNLSTPDDFKLLTTVPLSPRSIEGVERCNPRQVRITVLNQTITVEMNFGSGFETVIAGFDLRNVPGQAAIPATLKMGFSGSTGAFTNFHEIRNLVIRSAHLTENTITSSLNPAPEGQALTLTATVRGILTIPTGSVTFRDGETVIGTGTLNSSGQAQITTSSLTNGTHPITVVYQGDSIYDPSVSPIFSQVVRGPDLAISQSYTIGPGNTVTYTITARNLGPSDANGAVIAGNLPAAPPGQSWSWTCTATGGAACGVASGTGNIDQTLGAFPPDSSVVFTVVGIIADPASWNNSATITTPPGRNDSNLRNNSSTVPYKVMLPMIRR